MGVDLGTCAWSSACTHHVAHATAIDVGLVCSKEDIRHLRGALNTFRIRETCHICFSNVLRLCDPNAPIFWHEEKVLGQVLVSSRLTIRPRNGLWRIGPIPVSEFAVVFVGDLEPINKLLHGCRGAAVCVDAWCVPEQSTTPERLLNAKCRSKQEKPKCIP